MYSVTPKSKAMGKAIVRQINNQAAKERWNKVRWVQLAVTPIRPQSRVGKLVSSWLSKGMMLLVILGLILYIEIIIAYTLMHVI